MLYATLENLASILMGFIDQNVTFEYTEASDENEHIAGEVRVLVDGAVVGGVVGGWVTPKSMEAWLLGAVWGVQRQGALI